MKISKSSLILIFASALTACSTSNITPQASGTGANADNPTVAATQPSAAAADIKNPDKIVCKRIVPTGSRLGVKTCKTVRQWHTIQQNAKQALRRSTIKSAQQNRDGG